ncbi:hypothetical protein [Arthrobacter sp. CG_A4]|uniref:hypothetical protein n=1 Tax=Arthrobacter sp. CG_A4 TaxID=3071706 RepID=UPI002E06027C|nr:hypothetical protein [Arthrobacter sp. CG_A4]
MLLVDARGGHHQAAGRTPDFFAAALAEFVAVTRLPASALHRIDDQTAVPAGDAPGRAVVVLVGSLAEASPGLAAAEAAQAMPGAVCINTGISGSVDPPLPTVNCFGYSRVTTRAVALILAADLVPCVGLVPCADPAAPAPLRG